MALSFELTQEQDILRRTMRDFAEQEILPQSLTLDKNEEFSYDLTKKMAAMGLLGMTVDPKYGGLGTDVLSYIIAVEELARVDGCQAATIAAANSLGIGPIYNFGNELQKQKYLPRLCKGDALFAFGLTEPNAGSDASQSKTYAKKQAQEWVLNGSKIFITNASTEISAGITVQCVTGEKPDGKKELSCIIVEKGTPGFSARTMHHKMTWRSSNTAEVYFDDCHVPESNLLGQPGEGFKQMMKTLDAGRLSIAAMGLGGAQGAYELALRYAKERKTFGKPLSDHQSIAFRLADCALEIETARLLLYKACWLKDQEQPFSKEAAMAKLYCSEVMHRVVDRAVQIHGGYGLMEEYRVAKFYRDQRLLEIGEGTSEVQRIVISRHLGCQPM